MVRLSIVVAVFLALHVVLGSLHPGCAWGVEFLRFYPPAVWVVFALLSTALLTPRIQNRVLDARLPGPDPGPRSIRSVVIAVVLLASALALFVGFRTATHLLGDGELALRSFAPEILRERQEADHAPLTALLLEQLSRVGDAETSYRFLSYAAGTLYLFLAVAVAGALRNRRGGRGAVLAFLLTAGYLQVFFGYVENYALLFPATLLYLLLGLRARQGALPFWTAAVGLGLVIPLHFFLATLLPSLVVVSGSGGTDASPGRGRAAAQGVFSLLLAAGISAGLLALLGFSPRAYLAETEGTPLLPLLDAPGFDQAYRLLSIPHLIDVLNQYLLVAPAAVLVLVLILFPPGRGGGAGDWFLFLAALFPVLFTLVANPKIGYFRDWDILAVAAVPLTVWAGVALAVDGGKPLAFARCVLLITGASLFHTGLWVGVNADEDRSIARFTHVLEAGALSPRARSYGWETLGTYQRERGRYDAAFHAYDRAVRAAPKNPRYWTLAANVLRSLGRTEEAVRYSRQALDLNPNSPQAHSDLGTAYFERGELTEALASYRRAIEMDPGFADAHYNLGNVYFEMGELETALGSYRTALGFDPDHAQCHYNLGNAYFQLQDYAAAAEQYRSAVRLLPRFADAWYNLGLACFRLGRPDLTQNAFERLLEVDPGFHKAPEIRNWLRNVPAGQR